MPELQIAICEDDEIEQKLLLSILKKSGIELHYQIFPSGESFLNVFREGLFDLIFMDIYMGGMSGVETVSAVREKDTDVFIAFTTSSQDYALEGYRLNVSRYIEKPVREKDVIEALQLAMMRKGTVKHITVRVDGKDQQIQQSHIVYAEQHAHKLLFHLTDGSSLEASGRLDFLMEDLEMPPFYRCHKSYLVNLSHVRNIDRELCVFGTVQGDNVHIRRDSIREAEQAFTDYMFAETRKGPL